MGVDTVDLGGLPETLRLELTYGILCARADPHPPTMTLHRLRRLVTGLTEAGVTSLLEPDEQNWPGVYRDGRTAGALQVPFLIFTITVLIQTGQRLGDAARLGLDCVVNDQQQAPYLRYHNHKMKRDALVPIGAELAAAINAQPNMMNQNGGNVLFPRSEGSQDPGAAVTNGMAAMLLRNWLVDCAFRDEQGQLVHLTAHQFRHTLATRLNKDVPQEVVRKILDHSSTQMTAHYARLHDSTVRRHWERARKVTIDGQPVLISQDSPLADGVWMKHHLAKATTSLPNGHCGLPLQQSCPHADA